MANIAGWVKPVRSSRSASGVPASAKSTSRSGRSSSASRLAVTASRASAKTGNRA